MRRRPVSQRFSVQRARAARQKDPQRPIARVRSASSAASNVSRTQKEPGRLGRLAASIDWVKVRLVSVGMLFLVMGGALWLRAGYIQVVDGPRLADMARRQHLRVETLHGRRGDIVDRNGLVLASTIESRSVHVNPQEIQNADETARTLATLLQMPQSTIRRLITEPKNFVWISRKISDRTATAVAEAGLSGVYLTTEQERVYPYREMAGQLLGFVGIDGQGLEGIEKAYDSQLAPGSAKITVERDAAGRRFYPGTPIAPGQLDGKAVRLTIDMQMQHIAEESIAAAVQKYQANWGGCIVVDVPSGEVLAWAQYPFFNPNSYSEYTAADWRNRLAMDALEPGSTLKPLIVAAALEEGATSLDAVYDCERGRWRFNGITIRDTSPRGELTLPEVVRYSSNIGMAKLGLDMGARRSWAYLSRLGFGTRTGLPVGENKGILRDPAQWTDVDTASTAFGQSLSATGAQMVKAYLALASGGEAKDLRIIMNTASGGTSAGTSGAPGAADTSGAADTRVFSEESARQVLHIMYEAMLGDGSGRRARIPGVLIGGKTGTAQKADESGTYGAGRLASFVGILPINQPRYLVLTMVDEPKSEVYGGVIAAPVFQQVMSRILAYQGMLPDPDAPAPVMPPLRIVVAEEGTANASEIPAEATAAAETGTVASAALAGSPSSAPAPATAVHVPTVQVPAVQAVTATANSEHSAPLRTPAVQPAQLPSTPPGVVPNVVGQSVRRAVEIMARSGVVPRIEGAGPVVIQQNPPAGSRWDAEENNETGACTLWLSEQS